MFEVILPITQTTMTYKVDELKVDELKVVELKAKYYAAKKNAAELQNIFFLSVTHKEFYNVSQAHKEFCAAFHKFNAIQAKYLLAVGAAKATKFLADSADQTAKDSR